MRLMLKQSNSVLLLVEEVQSNAIKSDEFDMAPVGNSKAFKYPDNERGWN